MARAIKVADVGDIPPGECHTVELEGLAVALFNVDGTIYAINNKCSHVGGPLGEGALIGKEVTCPWHSARFDVTSGEALSGPARGDVNSFKVSVDGTAVVVELQ